jgi:hypothetical protein
MEQRAGICVRPKDRGMDAQLDNDYGRATPPLAPRVSVAALLALVLAPIAGAEAQQRAGPLGSFASAVSQHGEAVAYSAIEGPSDPNDPHNVPPPPLPTGAPAFTIGPREEVAVLAAIPNDTETRFTCSVRNQAGVTGFLLCNSLKFTQWHGDRGALVRILLDQPYGYEGDLRAQLRDIEKFEGFAAKHQDSLFWPFAMLTAQEHRCRMMSNALLDVLATLQSIGVGRGRSSPTSARPRWSLETSRRLEQQLRNHEQQVQEVSSLCTLAATLLNEVPSPLTSTN